MQIWGNAVKTHQIWHGRIKNYKYIDSTKNSKIIDDPVFITVYANSDSLALLTDQNVTYSGDMLAKLIIPNNDTV